MEKKLLLTLVESLKTYVEGVRRNKEDIGREQMDTIFFLTGAIEQIAGIGKIKENTGELFSIANAIATSTNSLHSGDCFANDFWALIEFFDWAKLLEKIQAMEKELKVAGGKKKQLTAA
jgi:hypothetical protein